MTFIFSLIVFLNTIISFENLYFGYISIVRFLFFVFNILGFSVFDFIGCKHLMVIIFCDDFWLILKWGFKNWNVGKSEAML